MSATKLDREIIETFQRDGAVHLPGIFDQFWINKIAAGIEKNLQNPSRFAEKLKSEDGNGHYFNDYFNWFDIKEFQDIVRLSPAAEIAGQLMNTSKW